LLAVVVLIPAAWFLTRSYGAIGAAAAWTTYNIAGALIVPVLMHRRFLQGEERRLYFQDIGPPLVAVVVTTAVLRVLISERLPPAQLLVALALGAAAVQIAAIAAAQGTRRRALDFVRERSW
jgi:hypothetical protein